MRSLFFLGFVSCLFFCASADTPANCTYEDVRGIWTFYEGERSGENNIDCTSFKGPVVSTLKFELLFPNVAVDEYGNKGQWTMIYNQGFEVTINYRKFFAYSNYKTDGNVTTSYCDSTIIGWSHDILSKNWACYSGQKQEALVPKVHYEPKLLFGDLFKQDKRFVRAINTIQNSWRATVYPELEGKPISYITRRSGGLKSRIHSRVPSLLTKVSHEEKKLIRQLPEEFDWRNVNGVNFVSPVRNQGGCGSCYSFSSMGMLESRLRVQTNNTLQVTFSPQDIVSCSEYSQGCEGGFPYLIAGKYGQDFGVVPEECNPYSGKDSKCEEKKCKRYYVADYKYIGGFYGACNEDLMKLELVQNGPIAVSFEVYPDFQQYQGGIYHYTGLQSDAYRFDPFLITNHAVLAVGYGVEKKTGEKYWIVKNSWGENWGENGYFRIRRGTDEVNIESIAVAATIIP